MENKTNINITNEDCLEFLKKIKSDSVNLILTDPPYEISRTTGFQSVVNGVQRFAVSMDFGEWDYDFKGLDEVIKEFYRILKRGGTLIIFYDLWKISHLVKLLEDVKFKQLRFIEWLKTNPVPLNSKTNYLTNAREVAISAVKQGKPTFHSKYDNGRYNHPIYHGTNRCHPTQKPLKLFEELIKKHSNENDLIIDCFLGSGTTALASKNTNRNFAGCEIDSNYYKKSIKIVGVDDGRIKK